MQEIIEEFYTDTQAHIESVEESFLKLDKDPANANLIDDVFRRVHSVKGNAGVLGFSDIHAEGTKLETLLEGVREHKSVKPGEMDALFLALDALKEAVHLKRYGKTETPEKAPEPENKPTQSAAPQPAPNVQQVQKPAEPSPKAPPAAGKPEHVDADPEHAEEKPETDSRPVNDTHTFLTFTLGSEKYGLAILDVREIILMDMVTPVPNTKDFVDGVMNLRDQIIPVFSLKKRLMMDGSENSGDTERNIVIVEILKVTTGLKVDDVTGIVNIHTKDITPPDRFRGGIPTDFLLGIGETPDGIIILLNSADICEPEGLLY